MRNADIGKQERKKQNMKKKKFNQMFYVYFEQSMLFNCISFVLSYFYGFECN